MIKIEIIASNDKMVLGTYPYLFDSLYIGRSKRADLQFDDAKLPLKFLTIKCVLDQLVVQNEPNTPFYFVNGKKMSGTRRLQIGDVIAFGTHQIKILDFKRTSEDEDLMPLFEKLEKESPELKLVLEILEEKIIELENQDTHV